MRVNAAARCKQDFGSNPHRSHVTLVLISTGGLRVPTCVIARGMGAAIAILAFAFVMLLSFKGTTREPHAIVARWGTLAISATSLQSS